MSVCLSVCLGRELRENFSSDFRRNLIELCTTVWEKLIKLMG